MEGNSLLLGKGLSKDLVAKKFTGRSKLRNFSESTGKSLFIRALCLVGGGVGVGSA